MPVKDQNELLEFVLRGPFGGIQSELPPEYIEKLGFHDVVNMLFYKGECRVRPASNSLPVQPASPDPGLRIMDLVGTIADQTWSPASLRLSTGLVEPWVGVADFFNVDGNRLQVAMTPTRMLQWVANAWSIVPGGLTGLPNQKFTWAVVAEKLCFCQGVDKVQLWDGKTTDFAPIASSVPAKYLFELERRLIYMNTVESGTRAYQRVRWTAPGDPTDNNTLDGAGQIDLFNDLGPINGGCKLFQYGYIFQQKGITQVIPTGIGTNPLNFQQLSSSSKGLTCPYSLAVNGETTCYYVGKDNIYSFDGTSSSPIGDAPIGTARKGARSRIFSDLQGADVNDVVGYVSTSINGVPFNSYWLVIPNVATWVYNVDEGNWTRFTWTQRLQVIGTFAVKGPIRIKDLIGTIAQQMWSPATLINDNPFDSVFLGYGDGTPGLFDFTGWSEMPWLIETGQLAMSDYRHEKTIKKCRLIYRDYGESTILFQITNDRGQVWVPNFIDVPDGFTTSLLLGTNTGLSKEEMFMPSIVGMFHLIKMYGAPGQPFSFTELTPIYSVGGEQRYYGSANIYRSSGQ